MNPFRKPAVREAYNFHINPSLIVNADEDLSVVIQRFAESPELRGIFVADPSNRLLGVITQADLLDWARAKLGVGLNIQGADLGRSLRLASLMHASTAGAALSKNSANVAVTPDDSLTHALRLMIEGDLVVLPVIDDEYRLIGDLKLSEILAYSVQMNEQEQGEMNEQQQPEKALYLQVA